MEIELSKLDQVRALREARVSRAERRAKPKPKPKPSAARAAAPVKAKPEKARAEKAQVVPVVRRGRPRHEDRKRTLAALKPWKKAGMSRASWYRRQAEKNAANQKAQA